jgi:hypothetical protein
VTVVILTNKFVSSIILMLKDVTVRLVDGEARKKTRKGKEREVVPVLN